jgi:beta-ribofuranosylaminobenzene 5'-phosphate synthase
VLAPAELVALCGRGGTSGIGIHGFQRGGFLVDAGHRAQDKPGFLPSRHATGVTPPELLFAAHPPPHWGVLLAVPSGLSGLEGDRERDFMVANTPVPLPEVQATSHLVLMGLIPAVLEGDVEAFGLNLTRIQDVGWKSRHWRRPELRAWRSAVDALVGAGATGAGLSSTGALVFGVYDRTRHDDREIAARAAADLTARGLAAHVSTTTIGGPATVQVGALAAPTATGAAR